MNVDNSVKFDTMSEADLEPVLELLQGENPDAVARKAGMTKERLWRIRDDLLAHVERERAKATDAPLKTIGRNAPCPCGSGKKYKHCCLRQDKAAIEGEHSEKAASQPARKTEQAQLIKRIEKAFGLLRSGRYSEAIERASTLCLRYPNEDRLHDIMATGHVYAGQSETAIDICRKRMAVAKAENTFFLQHGRYRDAQNDKTTLSYFYPPLTWLQKYWIALKSGEYQTVFPVKENAAIIDLAKTLETADDVTRFPENQARGLELPPRRFERNPGTTQIHRSRSDPLSSPDGREIRLGRPFCPRNSIGLPVRFDHPGPDRYLHVRLRLCFRCQPSLPGEKEGYRHTGNSGCIFARYRVRPD
jgi:hypothetical protein